MTLNIKDPQAHDLARKLSKETGETLTLAVIEALRERLDRVTRTRRNATAEELLSIGRRCSQTIDGRPIPSGDMLYNDQGLPK